jgi:hypothetical protein
VKRRLQNPETLSESVVYGEGFDFEGEHYKTLSAVAKAITGQYWNGFRFFKIHKQESA